MCYMCHNTHILVKRKMKKNKNPQEKTRRTPAFMRLFWLSPQKLAMAMEPSSCWISSNRKVNSPKQIVLTRRPARKLSHLLRNWPSVPGTYSRRAQSSRVLVVA